jgi:hypothetical protein
VSVAKQAVAAVVAGVAALTLSGCGAASPGVAAKVGDETISVADVDRLTTGYCEAFEDQFKASGEVYPLRYVRGYVVGQLTLQAAAEQFAADNGVTLGADYTQEIKDLEAQAAAFPAAARDDLVAVETASRYVTAVETAVGTQLLQQEGDTSADDATVSSRGRDAFIVWLGEHPADVNPRYGIQVADGAFTDVETGTSYALSPNAVAAAKAQPDQAYAGTLPSSQRCG